MKILIIPNSFKGSITSARAAKAIETGILRILNNCCCKTIGLADGGDGSLDLWLQITGGELKCIKVANACGKEINAGYGWNPDYKLAFIESAQASGIAGLNKNELNPLLATSYGTGLIIKEAIEQGAEQIFIALGGSATIDGGTGLLNALNVEFFDSKGKKLGNESNLLTKFQEIKLNNFIKTGNLIKWTILTDVNNPLYGETGAAKIFGAQKGATSEIIEILDNKMVFWHNLLIEKGGKNISDLKGSGAAGGMGTPFLSFFDATLKPGFEWFSSIMGLESIIPEYDLVITGEGEIDNQSFMGKGPGSIAFLAKQNGCKLLGVTGSYKSDNQIFDFVYELTNGNITREESIQNPEKMLIKAGEECGRYISGLSF